MSKVIDITGQDFGYWHVLERGPNDARGKAYWLCHCTACDQTTKLVSSSHLRSGRSTNCGCVRIEKMREKTIKHEEGKMYGFLYVNRLATEEEKPRHDRTGAYWNCTCTKCGRENVIVFGDYLRKGDTTSCGCIQSKNESIIASMLKNSNIQFVQQYKFDDLTPTGRACDRLLFDFAVFNNDKLLYLIEYDGAQHFDARHEFSEGGFARTHSNDLLKNKYCFQHNIFLIRIPYDSKYDINDVKLETTRFLLTPQNETEYYESRKEKINYDTEC